MGANVIQYSREDTKWNLNWWIQRLGIFNCITNDATVKCTLGHHMYTMKNDVKFYRRNPRGSIFVGRYVVQYRLGIADSALRSQTWPDLYFTYLYLRSQADSNSWEIFDRYFVVT